MGITDLSKMQFRPARQREEVETGPWQSGGPVTLASNRTILRFKT
jgi:hypothetical protein